MTYLDIVKGINFIKVKGNLEYEFVGKIRIDSRRVSKGDIFVALKGNKVDGNDFIDSAIKSGAVCIITEKEIEVPDGILLIQVPNTEKSILELATLIRKRYINIPLIAVTGSLGKTTTKEFIYTILSKKYRVLKNEGNQNNHIGVPLTLFELDETYDICVIELGMNHLREIHELSCCCKPNTCVITNIGTSHIGNLGSKKNIFKAKLEIIDGIDHGTLIINGDDPYLKKINRKNLKVIKCGLKRNNTITATDILCTQNSLYFNIKLLEKYYPVIFSIPNLGYIYNILISLTVGLHYQIPVEDIITAVEEYKTIKQRSEIITLEQDILLIDDSYNSSFESLKKGLEMLEYFSKEKIIILGDILELGDFSKKIHKRIKKILGNYYKIILVGEEMRNACCKDCICCKNVEEVINYFDTLNIRNKLIYVKGSHGMQLWKLVDKIKKDFPIKKV